MSKEAEILILQELRALRGEVSTMGAQLARLQSKVQRPDLVKYSIDEAAERLGIGRSTLYREIDAGRIETVKEKTRRFVTEQAVQSWERAQRRAA